MLNGDISNETPKRVLVAESLVIIKQPRMERKFKLIPVVKHDLLYDKIMLNKLWHYSMRAGVNLELISFDHDEEELDQIYAQLEDAGVNPFKGYSHYKSPTKLAKDLTFRKDVIGVLDPDNQLKYGSKGLDL